MNIICFGDSITSAKDFAEGDRWPTILQFKLNAWRPDIYKVYNRGIGGNTTAQGLERMEEDVLPYLPGLLLIQFGFNDSNIRPWSQVSRVGIEDYQKNLREFQRIAAAHQSQCVFIINHLIARNGDTHRMPNGENYNTNFAPYDQAIRQVVENLKAPAIDLPRLMQEQHVSIDSLVSEDGLHLSIAGNHRYAEMVFTALQTSIL